MQPIVIIPAYNPDETLIRLVQKLEQNHMSVLVIDDGSSLQSQWVFEELEQTTFCGMCRHITNKGKGAALKTGIRHAALTYPECIGYVTADADGQHSPKDIRRVMETLEQHPDSFVLGTRDFSKKGVPLKSRFGNRITSLVYLLSTGKRCADTQTGLRGIPRKWSTLCLEIPGEKYEYEMNQLLEIGRREIPCIPISMDTIYLDGNQSSHFHPIRDSVRIYWNIIRYSLSSLVSAFADLTMFTVLVNFVMGKASLGIMEATIAARLFSGVVNFTINKFWVFQSTVHHAKEAIQYFMLFLIQMCTSWILVAGLRHLPLNLTLIKILVDTSLFFISYQVQKNGIFNTEKEREMLNR